MHISSLLCMTLGLKGHRVKRVRWGGGKIVAELAANKRSRPACSSRGGKMPGYDTPKRRSWRHVQIWGISVTLTYSPGRGGRKDHGIEVEAMPWSQGKIPLSLPSR